MIEEARRELARMASVIQAPAALLPSFEPRTSDWWIAVDAGRYQLSFEDGGTAAQTKTFATLDALLEEVFESVTFAMASDWEAENRVLDVDFRRLLFARQEALLARLSQAWAARAQARHREVLDAYPPPEGSA